MHTYKTLQELEKQSENMPLDHVMNHPFFAKKSSLQEAKKHKMVLKELEVLTKVTHPNIISVKEILHDNY